MSAPSNWHEQFPGLDPNMLDVPAGWVELVIDLLNALSEIEGWSVTHVVQIKEKFGGLRFYHNDHREAVEHLVAVAEGKSWILCQECGAEQAVQVVGTHGFVKTLCAEHAAKGLV